MVELEAFVELRRNDPYRHRVTMRGLLLNSNSTV
jgi:hypothetical protein